ncbi:MAG: right-handed parallel beta-helix repeat-containing protein [Clostridia bacterium]|jgi:hypothetical protein
MPVKYRAVVCLLVFLLFFVGCSKNYQNDSRVEITETTVLSETSSVLETEIPEEETNEEDTVVVLYVSLDGTGDGSSPDKPLPDLYKAFEAVSDLREEGVLDPIVIRMLGGTYAMPSPLTIAHSVYDVTVEPYDDEKVVISGGRRISGFSPAVFNGTNCYAAFIEDVKKGDWVFTDLYVNEERASLTRYPDEGYLYKIGQEVSDGGFLGGSKWFIAKKEDIKDFKNLNDCIVSFNHYWVDEHSPIESYDKETGKLTLKYRSRYEIYFDIGYYIENVAEQFKNPGEWYLDRPEGMLYYIPRSDDETPDNIEVYAPVTETLIEIKGDYDDNLHVSNIRFYGLTFAYTKGDYVSMEGVPPGEEGFASDSQGVSGAQGVVNLFGAKDCFVEDCTFRNYGLYGITVNEGCSGIRITGCEFYDGGAGGIKINGGHVQSPKNSRTFGNTITDNTITRCGRRHLAACGILAMHTYDNDISHNEISDLFYSGISCGRIWGYYPSVNKNNIISYNHIYNIGQGLLSDMGGIYLLGPQPGTTVSNNLIHDIQSGTYGGWALYADEGSMGILFENNICYNTSDNCFNQHYGTRNTVRNNIFAFSGKGMIQVARFEKHVSIEFVNNIIYTDGCPVYSVGDDPESGENHITAAKILSSNNILWSKDGEEPMITDREGLRTLSEVQKYGFEKGSIIADPGFTDPENYDFTLKENSPAFEMGFQKIDMSQTGVRRNHKGENDGPRK